MQGRSVGVPFHKAVRRAWVSGQLALYFISGRRVTLSALNAG
jgi:hypothetical protein